MANSYTDKYKKRQPAAGDLNWDDEINQDQSIDDIIGAARDKNNRAIWGLAASDGGGLSVDYAAGRAEVGGSIFEIAAGSKTAVDDASDRSANYLYVDSSGVVQIVQSPLTGVYAPIALIDVSSGAIDRIGDFRQQPSNLLADEVLAEINKIIVINASIVDVFLYDTSKDSDGGAWRERTEHTSWYNETLDTSTRGSTRKFPAIALIVAEPDTVTIYDATDVSFPMWIVFSTGSFAYIRGDVEKCKMFNGDLLTAGGTSGPSWVSFIKDASVFSILQSANNFRVVLPLVDRNNFLSANRISVNDSDFYIVDNDSNDVAITVLPTAPIDQATQLPVSTIAIATDAGVSVITDAGVVWDITRTSGFNRVSFQENNRLFISAISSSIVEFGDIPTADISDSSWRDGFYGTGGSLVPLGGASGAQVDKETIGNIDGLTLLKEDPETPATGMVNYITTDYQSGWMQGDIKGAWFADTTVESLTTTDPDRSVNGNDLTVTGTITKTAAATGAELVEYSGFTSGDYLFQPYNSDLDVGTGDFYVKGWGVTPTSGTIKVFISRYALDGADPEWSIRKDAADNLVFASNAGATKVTTPIITDKAFMFVFKRVSGIGYLNVNGKAVASSADTTNYTNTAAILGFGVIPTTSPLFPLIDGSLSLCSMGAGAPTDEQIEHIYETEKHLFQENADCTLSGTSDAVAALAYDDVNDLLYVGTGDGVSVFSGLQRVDYIDTTGIPTNDAVNSLSASGGAYIIGNAAEAVGYIPAANLREEITRQEQAGEVLELTWFDGDTSETDFVMPTGWKPKFVYEAGLIVKEGSGEDYTVTFDGFLYTVVFASAPAAVNIGVMGVTS